MPPDLSAAVAVVNPSVNLSSDSSNMNPISLPDEDIPEFNSIMLSAMVVFVELFVVVEPLIVKSVSYTHLTLPTIYSV